MVVVLVVVVVVVVVVAAAAACAVGDCGADDDKPCGHHGQENRGTLIAEHRLTDKKEQTHCQSEIGIEHTK